MHATIDPLGVFMAGAFASRGAVPVPLVATHFDVALEGGLAVVTTTRRFRNIETGPIEAIVTFPMPVHAALYALEARIDGRLLHATAQRREQARETYEDAITDGKAAVLHEELLRGIHMLSVGNLRAGGEIEVTCRWATALSLVGGEGRLRIPLTAGDVYGCSGLSDSDELIHGSEVRQQATITLHHAGGTARIEGTTLREGRGQVPMNRPIDIVASAWTPRPLTARAADGRSVTLMLSPAPVGEARAAVALLVDRSGSMEEPFDANRVQSKHEVAATIARTIAAGLDERDRFDLWQFNATAKCVGQLDSVTPAAAATLFAGLLAPVGGTEIGRAIETVAGGSIASDILLITDGKSWRFDVQRFAMLGKRISVLLIGEDSLEAGVGHLAAMTGGELFIASSGNLTAVAAAMLRAIRMPHVVPASQSSKPEAISVARGGTLAEAHWRTDTDMRDNDPVRAYAASLALSAMGEKAAAALAEAEGLVTHLTSLVLVDDVGEAQQDLPTLRKVALETPRGARLMPMSSAGDHSYAAAAPMARLSKRAAPVGGASILEESAVAACFRSVEFYPTRRLHDLARQIVWSTGTPLLAKGDVSTLDGSALQLLRELELEFQEHADRAGVPVALLILLLAARLVAPGDRSAARVETMLWRRIPEGQHSSVMALAVA